MTSATSTANSATPTHIPTELIWDHDFDAYNRELDDPFLASARLHDGPDLLWAQGGMFGEPAWLPTRKALMEEIFRDTARFSSDRANVSEALGVTWKLNPLEFDPPEHQRYRNVLNPLFTPKAVSELDEPVRAVCDELIGQFAERGRCEFVGEFAEKFPSYVFLDLMGLPRDMLPSFLSWEADMMRGETPEIRVAAMRSVLHYLEKFVDEQRQHPTTQLLKGITGARLEDGRPLNRDEILGMCYLLYIGGLDTVYSTLGWIMRHLAMDPSLQTRLREDPALLPRALEEFLRAYPVARPHRVVTEDTQFHGVTMKKGDMVLLPTWLAGRDPAAYDNPHDIDLDRRPRHLTFAAGPHICLGLHLAKRELRTVLEAFLGNLKNIRLAPGEHYQYHTGGTLGVDSLPLEWDL